MMIVDLYKILSEPQNLKSLSFNSTEIHIKRDRLLQSDLLPANLSRVLQM